MTRRGRDTTAVMSQPLRVTVSGITYRCFHVCSEYRAYGRRSITWYSMCLPHLVVNTSQCSSKTRRTLHHRNHNVAYLLALAHALRDPCLHLRPGLVDRQKARFSSALDQLVRLHNERCACEPRIVLLNLGEARFSASLKHVCFHLP